MDEEGLVDVLMEPADNILDLKLTCRPQPYGNVMMGMNGSIGEILPVFKKWQHLRRLGLFGEGWVDAACPVLNLVCHFILDMKSLTYLYISDVGFKSNEIITLKREVDDWVKLRRPGFSFKISNYRLSDDSWYPFIV
jgi:hypothetical protein